MTGPAPAPSGPLPVAAPVADPTARRALVEERLAIVRRELAATGAAGALLERRADAAWLTAGAELHVVHGADAVAAPILVTADAAVVLAPNNEAARIAEEETGDLQLALEVTPWFQPDAVDAAVERLLALPARGSSILRGGSLADVLALPRQRLAPLEHERMRWLAAVARTALDSASASIRPGHTEADVVAALVGPLAASGVRAPVVLAGADERMRFRHPLPTLMPIRDRLMLVLVAERWGLHVAATRMAWLGGEGARHPADLQAGRVLAAMAAASTAGTTLGELLDVAAAAYEAEGLPAEWHNHHQGGTIGYGPRERIATPDDPAVLEAGMAVAWNPSVPGGKAEATLLVTDGAPELLLD